MREIIYIETTDGRRHEFDRFSHDLTVFDGIVYVTKKASNEAHNFPFANVIKYGVAEAKR